jgi:hypothetical protein
MTSLVFLLRGRQRLVRGAFVAVVIVAAILAIVLPAGIRAGVAPTSVPWPSQV